MQACYRAIAVAVVLGVVVCSAMGAKKAAAPAKPVPAAVRAPDSAATKPATQPTAPAKVELNPAANEPGEVMAKVNGTTIYMSELYELVLPPYGLQYGRQLIANELVRQHANKAGITVTKEEVQEEIDKTLKRLFPDVQGADQRQRLLEQLLANKCVTEKHWEMAIERNVQLTKLAARRVTISDEDIRKEFGEQYGRKVEVRHIQSANLLEAQEVKKQLEGGADFAQLAQKVSKNASAMQGGLLAPIGQNTQGLPPALRDAALAMTKVGELSDPIQIGTTFHLLKLERIIEPQNVKFEAVKDKVAADLRASRIEIMKQQMLIEMLRYAQGAGQIEYVNPVLRTQNEQAAQESEAAQ